MQTLSDPTLVYLFGGFLGAFLASFISEEWQMAGGKLPSQVTSDWHTIGGFIFGLALVAAL